MRVCPVCQCEYEAHVRRCPDCDAELRQVSDLEELAPAASQELLSLPVSSRSDAELAHKLLLQQGVPCEIERVDARKEGLSLFRSVTFLLRIESAYAGRALGLLLSELPGIFPRELASYLQAEAARPGASDQELEAVRRTSIEELVEGGSRSLFVLVKALLRGDEMLVRKAELALVQIGEPAARLLTNLVCDACRLDDRVTLGKLRSCLARLADPGTVERIAGLTKDRDPIIRANALRVLGRLANRAAIPYLVQGLGDEQEKVREEANESLWRLTGRSFGFDARAPLEERRAAQGRWQEWAVEQGFWA